MNAAAERSITEWPELGLNYWSITKCANSSIKVHLHELSGNTLANEFRGYRVNKKSLSKYISAETALSNGLINFTVTRNPYNRFLSAWRDLCIKRPERGIKAHIDVSWSPLQLAEYCLDKSDSDLDVHFRSQNWFVNKNIEHIFQLENLHTQWCLDIPILKHHAHRTIDPADTKLCEKTKEIVNERYSVDFERFNY